MTLDDYLSQHGIGQSEFGKQLDPPVSQGLVSQWVRGVTRITLHQALQIQEITSGKVSPSDCAEMYKAAA